MRTGIAGADDPDSTPLAGQRKVGTIEERGRDGHGRNEVLDLDRPARLDVRLLEVLVGHDDELPLLDLVALDDIAPRNGAVRVPVDVLVADERVVAAVDLMERKLVGSLARVEAHGDLHEAEAYRSRP